MDEQHKKDLGKILKKQVKEFHKNSVKIYLNHQGDMVDFEKALREHQEYDEDLVELYLKEAGYDIDNLDWDFLSEYRDLQFSAREYGEQPKKKHLKEIQDRVNKLIKAYPKYAQKMTNKTRWGVTDSDHIIDYIFFKKDVVESYFKERDIDINKIPLGYYRDIQLQAIQDLNQNGERT